MVTDHQVSLVLGCMSCTLRLFFSDASSFINFKHILITLPRIQSSLCPTFHAISILRLGIDVSVDVQ